MMEETNMNLWAGAIKTIRCTKMESIIEKYYIA